jgi:hypothetical protein
VGQPELRNLLSSPQLEQLRQRVSLWFHILPLSFEETAEYIQYRLSKAGCPRNPFSRKAVKCIYRASGGIPRLINIACDAALLAGYVEQKQKIRAWLVDKALDELNLKKEKLAKLKKLDLKKEEKVDHKKFSIFKRWRSNTDRNAGQSATWSAGQSADQTVPIPLLSEELELLSHTVSSLYQKYRQRVSEKMPKQCCFPDDLSLLQGQESQDHGSQDHGSQNQEFEDTIILAQIISLSMAIKALRKRITGD